jgi:hypothetical protein
MHLLGYLYEDYHDAGHLSIKAMQRCGEGRTWCIKEDNIKMYLR